MEIIGQGFQNTKGLDRRDDNCSIGVPGGCDSAGHAALHAAATQPNLYGNHAGQAAARADRAEKGVSHRGTERPSAKAVFRTTYQFDGK